MAHEADTVDGSPLVQGLFESIEDEARMGVRLTRQPTVRRA